MKEFVEPTMEIVMLETDSIFTSGQPTFPVCTTEDETVGGQG